MLDLGQAAYDLVKMNEIGARDERSYLFAEQLCPTGYMKERSETGKTEKPDPL
jgi:hypothetical protein